MPAGLWWHNQIGSETPWTIYGRVKIILGIASSLMRTSWIHPCVFFFTLYLKRSGIYVTKVMYRLPIGRKDQHVFPEQLQYQHEPSRMSTFSRARHTVQTISLSLLSIERIVQPLKCHQPDRSQATHIQLHKVAISYPTTVVVSIGCLKGRLV